MPARVARFRQIDTESPHVHHDALEFPDGRVGRQRFAVLPKETKTVTVVCPPPAEPSLVTILGPKLEQIDPAFEIRAGVTITRRASVAERDAAREAAREAREETADRLDAVLRIAGEADDYIGNGGGGRRRGAGRRGGTLLSYLSAPRAAQEGAQAAGGNATRSDPRRRAGALLQPLSAVFFSL